MGSYNQLLLLYKNVKEQPVDPQIVMLCQSGAYSPLEVVLAQFKFLLNRGMRGDEYSSIRGYLVKVFGKQIIDDMEAM